MPFLGMHSQIVPSFALMGLQKQPVIKYVLRKKTIDYLFRICALFYTTEM